MPNYDHACKSCKYEWEEVYSVNADPPTVCPECGGAAGRVIKVAPAVKMKLEGNELKQHIVDERKKIRKQVKEDEKLKANLMGEEKYNKNQNDLNIVGEKIRTALM